MTGEDAQPQPVGDGRGPDASARDVVIAAVIPAIGIVRGLIWLQNSPRAAWQMMVAALVGFAIWMLVLAAVR